MYKVDWTVTAELTYNKEIDFILMKWSFNEAQKFIDLVDDVVKTLGLGTMTGKVSKIENVYIVVFSEQTSLAYKVFEDKSKIELLTFWNNQFDPEVYKEFIDTA